MISMLLIDDDEIFQTVFKRMLNKWQFDQTIDLKIASNGKEALNLLKECKDLSCLPHICLLDLNMPVMDGHEFLKTIRQDELLKKMIVFVVSTSDYINDVEQAYSEGISGYLVKDRFGDKYERLGEFLKVYLRSVTILADYGKDRKKNN